MVWPTLGSRTAKEQEQEAYLVARQGTRTLFSRATSELECFFIVFLCVCIVHSVVWEDNKMVGSQVFPSRSREALFQLH